MRSRDLLHEFRDFESHRSTANGLVACLCKTQIGSHFRMHIAFFPVDVAHNGYVIPLEHPSVKAYQQIISPLHSK